MSAETMVPSTVARGMVRRGSMTSPAGTVADSMPRNANIVMGAVAARALRKGCPLGFTVSKECQSIQKSPSRANTMPSEIAPTAITAQPINAVVPKRASTEGAMKNPEPTMLPITSAVQVASPRLLLPRWSVAGVTVAPFTARRRSFRQRHEAEEGQGARGGLPDDARVEVSDLSRSVQAAQRAVHDQAEILVAARQSKGERLVRVMAR